MAPGSMSRPRQALQKKKTSDKDKVALNHPRRLQPNQKKFKTVIVVTATTDEQGDTSYQATASPVVEIQTPAAVNIKRSPTPFLDRMWERNERWADYMEDKMDEKSMYMISVKRQRKLKMKKHKYKKLMRRTRNVRRKLGKL